MPSVQRRSTRPGPRRSAARPPLHLSPAEAAGGAARRVLARQLADLNAQEAPARSGDVEGIHDFRVATRRLRATLRLFAPVLPAGEVRRLRASLAWVARAIGAVRDLDVLAQALAARAQRLEPGLRRALAPVRREIRTRRADAHAHLLEVVDSRRYAAVRRRLARLVQWGGALRPAARIDEGSPARVQPRPRRREGPTLGAVAGDLLRPVWEDVAHMGHRVRGDADAATYHRLRVRVKRLRYALEALRSLPGTHTRHALADLERLQYRLGALQDSETQGAWLRTWAGAARVPPATLLATGAVLHLLARRAARARARSARVWRRFARHQRHQRTLGSFALLRSAAAPVARGPARAHRRRARSGMVTDGARRHAGTAPAPAAVAERRLNGAPAAGAVAG
jgi:CHAD domain-containing protein